MCMEKIEKWRHELDEFISAQDEGALTNPEVIAKARDLENKMFLWEKEHLAK